VPPLKSCLLAVSVRNLVAGGRRGEEEKKGGQSPHFTHSVGFPGAHVLQGEKRKKKEKNERQLLRRPTSMLTTPCKTDKTGGGEREGGRGEKRKGDYATSITGKYIAPSTYSVTQRRWPVRMRGGRREEKGKSKICPRRNMPTPA